MATESTGGTDPDRTLPLLWRRQLASDASSSGKRGPRQRITVDRVVEVAIAAADEDGLAALSLRKIAERLSIGVMTLYTYVPGKAELLELMIDEVVARIPRDAGTADTLRGRLDALAREEWSFYTRHSWVLQVDTSRPPLGPGSTDRYEYQLTLVDGLGIGDLDMNSIVTLVTGFTAGCARSAVEAQQTRSASGQTDLQWWEANVPVLERVMDESRYPLSGRVGQVAGEYFQAPGDASYEFEFGLARMLDGIDAYLAR